ncbi:MAG: hypothetical protein M1817_000183 [Caeruleum heppii]|nr:MAG: hypothetical protein M1817_000183 [Caeruleum heppii]
MVDRANKPSAIPVSPTLPSPHVFCTADNSRVVASLPSGESVEVLLHGATVVSWKCAETENLFVSEKAVLDGSKPVRGGIPLVFPVFGPPPSSGPLASLPQHGFARSSRWEFLDRSSSESSTLTSAATDNSVKLDFGLSSSNMSPEALRAWPHKFSLIYSVTLSKNSLETMMLVRNESDVSFEFQMLMHTYLRVKDIGQVAISGLNGSSYIDKVKSASKETQSQSELAITSETDRVYTGLTPHKPIVVLEAGNPRFEVTRDNLEDLVVWNPWIEKAAGMSDFAPRDAYKQMICIEAGAVNGWQKLEPGDTFEGVSSIKSVL